MEENNELITIIVPVYNVEKYLCKCIDSVLIQTYKNFELVIIDDGSTDNSGNICDTYKNKDNRIRVIHKENGGLSDARNFGIENAHGKYITFIDSDDYLKNTYIEYLYKLIKEFNTDISICAYTVFTDTGKCIDYGKGYKREKLDKIETFKRMLNEEGFSVSSCAKLYKTTLFNDIRYPKGKLCEDNGTTYKLIDKVDQIAYGNESQYYYLKRKRINYVRVF